MCYNAPIGYNLIIHRVNDIFSVKKICKNKCTAITCLLKKKEELKMLQTKYKNKNRKFNRGLGHLRKMDLNACKRSLSSY